VFVVGLCCELIFLQLAKKTKSNGRKKLSPPKLGGDVFRGMQFGS
jgi:hypothetical protein